jgi:hypothetical protein
MAETVKSIVKQVADGTMDAAAAGAIIGRLVTRRPAQETEAERMKRYYEGHHEAAIETDPNAFNQVLFQYDLGKISKAQMEAIQKAMHGTNLSEGTEYALTEGERQYPVRKVDGEVQVFSADGWAVAPGGLRMVPCTEAEALAAAKKVMGS